MQRAKRHWLKLPGLVRRVLTLVLGALLIVTAGLIGPIPGPGGTVLFLLGIAVLATEFTWAERLRDYLMNLYKQLVVIIKKRPAVSAVVIIAIVVVGWICLYFFYTYFI